MVKPKNQKKTPKYRWAAGIIFYNDKTSLKRCLDSIHQYFDWIFCIDGKYSTFVGTKGISTDGGRNLVKKYSNTILQDISGTNQPAKRNKYLELAKENNIDFLVVIDTDEYIMGNFSLFKKNAEKLIVKNKNKPRIFNLRVTNVRKRNYSYLSPRLLYKPGKIRMLTISHRIYHNYDNKPPLEIIPISKTQLEELEIYNDDSLRSQLWLDEMYKHQKWQILYELQLEYKNHPFFKEHIEVHGFEKLQILLEKHPKLLELLNDFQIEILEKPGAELASNPEFDKYISRIRDMINQFIQE